MVKAMWIPTTNFFPARAGFQPRYIILHGTAGGTSAAGIAEYFRSTQGTDRAVSAHYVIGTGGEVVQCVREADGAWANGVLTAGHAPFWPENINPNFISFSIEHCKPSPDNSDPLTPAQQSASFALIKELCDRWNIPAREADAQGGITGHFSIDPVNRSRCPGPYPWSDLWAFLKGEESSMTIDLSLPAIQDFFTLAPGGTWRCKQNGNVIGGAILDFYRKYGGMALCGLTFLGLPVSNEIGIPGKPPAVLQRFERGVLFYDPNHALDRPPGANAVYAAHLYQGYGQDPRYIQALTQIQQLQDQIKQSGSADLAAQLANAQKIVADLQSRLSQIRQIAAG